MDPALRKAIYDKYIAPTQKQRPDYIGVEIEMPVVNLANEPVDERVALAAAEQFAAHFGFQITGRGADGNFTSAQDSATGDIAENGVDHIELRMFDLNPAAPLGMDARDLQFAHLLMLYLLSLPDFDFTPELQTEAVAAHKHAALLEPDAVLTEQADEILRKMELYFSDSEDARNVIAFELEKCRQSPICSFACSCINR